MRIRCPGTLRSGASRTTLVVTRVTARRMTKKDLVAFLTRWKESAPKQAGH
jgi:hypothetical protein